MREIKFRGKRVGTGEWIYGDLVHKAITAHSQIIQVGIKQAEYYAVEVIPETVGQFTGLQGCEGKEIYEGDVLEIITDAQGRCCVEIVFGVPDDTAGKYAAFGYTWGEADYFLCLSDVEATQAKVIGNLYDNADLLK